MNCERNKGITLIALIITIIVLLILAGITISALTGSDSAPAKANEAEQKNDIGSAKDQIGITAINAKTEAYETAYVGNSVSAGNASTSVGQAVIDAVLPFNNTNTGKASIEVTQAITNNVKGDASISITTRDFVVEGTITLNDGILTWGEIEQNVPGIKIINVPNTLDKNASATLSIKRKKVSQDAQVTWTSLTTDYATVNPTTGKVTGIAEGPATIKASVTDVGNTYTAECTISIREIVMPQVGDFVTYDAGSWTTDANGKILIHYLDGTTEAVTNSSDLPNTSFKFGGFTTTSGKNGNATPYDSTYNYVKEKTTGSAITGWRIFDISNDGITLISAGCPEDYYHIYNKEGNAYISEYILSGNVNSEANTTNLGLGSTYKIRNWTKDYVSETNQNNGITAGILTKTKLENWYKKYVDSKTLELYYNEINYDDILGINITQKILKTDNNAANNGKYESLIDNYSKYWLDMGYNSGKYLCMFDPDESYVRQGALYNGAFGIRILINLPASITLTNTRIGTKTITSRDVDYTYNVWGIN